MFPTTSATRTLIGLVILKVAFLHVGCFGFVPPSVIQAHSVSIPRPQSSPQLKGSDDFRPRPRRMVTTVQDDSLEKGGIYRPFAEFAWSKLAESGIRIDMSDGSVPKELKQNSSPARGMPDGSTIEITIRSTSDTAMNNLGADDKGVVRLARYALLETLSPERKGENNAIQVLNFVVFPDTGLKGLPVLGVDLVTLPGHKHLIAIDFQPVLPPTDTDPSQQLLPERYHDFLDRLKATHSKYVKTLPWGGDIPPQAQRFFSPYALWTRLIGEGALTIVQNEVWNAFVDYVSLYYDLLGQVQDDVDFGLAIEDMLDADDGRYDTEKGDVPEYRHEDKEDDTYWSSPETEVDDTEKLEYRHDEEEDDGYWDRDIVVEGQRDYLEYRRANDPARPMLRSLYGEEWTEKLISEVLFRQI